MDEYIRKDAVLDNSNIITVQTKEYGSIEVIPVDTIADIKLADVQPAKRGEWGKRAYDRLQCSCCGKCEDIATDFCPNCGAKMLEKPNLQLLKDAVELIQRAKEIKVDGARMNLKDGEQSD